MKPFSEFHKNPAAPWGVNPSCKVCKTAQVRALRARDPERTRAARRTYYAANADRIRAQDAATRSPERRAASNGRYRDTNRERLQSAQRAYYQANKARIQERNKAWAKANPTATAAAVRRYRERHPEIRTILNQNRRARLAKALVGPIDLDALWNGRCGICSEPLDRDVPWPHPKSPSIDHIVALAAGGEHSQTNLQWSHLLCNIRKGAA